MNKKFIAIIAGLSILIIITIVLFIMSNNKDGITTCYTLSGTESQIWKFDVKNDDVDKLEITINKSSLKYGYETLENLSLYQKKEIEEKVLNDLNIDSLNYNGITIEINYKEYLEVIINIDYSLADTYVLNKMKLNYNNEIKFSEYIKVLQEDNLYVCK